MAQKREVTLQELATYDIVTYTHGFTGRSDLDEAFGKVGLKPKNCFTCNGCGCNKNLCPVTLRYWCDCGMAFDPMLDSDLVAIDMRDKFSYSTTKLHFDVVVFTRLYV